MKKYIILACSFLWSLLLFSQIDYQISDYNVSLSGNSTLHKWTANVNAIAGSSDIEIINGNLIGLTNLKVKIDATSIKSKKGGSMDKNIYKALKTKEHQYIVFNLKEILSLKKVGNKTNLTVIGELTIAGTKKTTILKATGTATSENGYAFRGVKKIKMSDYNIEPAEIMFGIIKAENEVTVKFEVVFTNSGLSKTQFQFDNNVRMAK